MQLAMQANVNRRELCRRFGISPKTGYKWLARYTAAGPSGLRDRSRRPRRSPARTSDEVAERVIQLRRESRNCWGERKLARLLTEEGGPRLAPSTITGILRRAGLLDAAAAPGQRAWQRFEHVAPNAYRRHAFRVCKALYGLPIALRRVPEADSQPEVLFCHQVIARIDLN